MSSFPYKNEYMEKDSYFRVWSSCTEPTTDIFKVGTNNPIELAYFRFEYVNRGNLLNRRTENYAKIYDANPCFMCERDPNPRLFKAIPLGKFANGDEVRITKIAAMCGVAPKFFSAFLTNEENRSFVYIEMEHGGNTTYRSKVDDFSEREMISLFTKIKILAQNKIAYKDLHLGNILADGRLIDFDGAKLCSSENEAVFELFNKGAYFPVFITKYQNREDLSEESKNLISWFNEHDLSDVKDAKAVTSST